jgi:hypothetical protein
VKVFVGAGAPPTTNHKTTYRIGSKSLMPGNIMICVQF